MKEIVQIDQDIGGDGGKIAAALGVQGDQLAAQVVVTYPIAKIVEPALEVYDKIAEKIGNAIPGDWDNKLLADLRVEFKDLLVKTLSEKAEPAPEAATV